MASKRLGKVAVKNTGLFLCDMQEKFRKTISYYPQILEVSRRMLGAANVLNLPVIVTEQYPKGILFPLMRSSFIPLCHSHFDPDLDTVSKQVMINMINVTL